MILKSQAQVLVSTVNLQNQSSYAGESPRSNFESKAIRSARAAGASSVTRKAVAAQFMNSYINNSVESGKDLRK